MPDPRSLKILVVDDQQSMRGMARQCLKRLGIIQVTLAANGDAALEAMKTQRFDAVISDLNMPGMSGLDLAAAHSRHAQGGDAAGLLLPGRSTCFRCERRSRVSLR